jgi:hypothetical protein
VTPQIERLNQNENAPGFLHGNPGLFFARMKVYYPFRLKKPGKVPKMYKKSTVRILINRGKTMKYALLILFNTLAIVLLAVFLFDNGGMIENIRRIQEIGRLEKQKIASETDLEELHSRLNYLESLKGPNATALISQGRKTDNLVVFKFVGQKVKADAPEITDNSMILNRIYLSIAVIVTMILAGNIALLVSLRRTARER